MATIEIDDDLMVKDENVCYVALGSWDYQFNFKEIYENQYYTIVSKDTMGKKIRKELLDKYGTFDEVYDEMNGEYDLGFVEEVLMRIEKEVTEKLRNEICEYVLYDCLSEYC